MTATKFKIGDKIKSENGCIWTITDIKGKHIFMQSAGLKEKVTENEILQRSDGYWLVYTTRGFMPTKQIE